MNVRHSFSIKNIFYDKMDLRLFYFDVVIYGTSEAFKFKKTIDNKVRVLAKIFVLDPVK